MDWTAVGHWVYQGGLSIGLVGNYMVVARKNRWGNVVGLCGQPFWLHASYHAGQEGMILAAFVQTVIWIMGIHKWFFVGQGKISKKATV